MNKNYENPNTAEELISLIKSDLSEIVENYSAYPDIHNAAYENNEEYKIFWDSLDCNAKESIIKVQKKVGRCNKINKAINKYHYACTFGLGYLIDKAINYGKPSPEEQIFKMVTENKFTENLRFLNNILGFHGKSEQENVISTVLSIKSGFLQYLEDVSKLLEKEV